MDRATKGILEVARSVLSELDLDAVLERVLDSARELTGARYAALGVLDESRSELVSFLTRGIDAQEREAIGNLPHGRGVLGLLIEQPVALRIKDLGAHRRSYGFPHAHPPMQTFLGVPIVVDETPFGNLYLTEKPGGGEFTDDDEEAVSVLAEFAAVAIDHARRYTGTREHRDELRRNVAALEATTQIARAVGGETDPEVVLQLIAKRGRALVSARTLLIELQRGDQLEVAAGAGELPHALIGTCLPLEETLAAHAIDSKRTQRLEDDLNRARFERYGVGRVGVEAQNGLVVPLLFRANSYGVLVALDRLDGGPAFTADDALLLESFASSAATAVATAQTVAAERQRQRMAAAEAERRRWARELHDDTLQSLSALRFGLSAARRSDEGLDAAMERGLDQIEEMIANLRALITDLRPAALDELGLQAAIEALAERSARNGIEVDVSIDLAFERGDVQERLASDIETSLYRIIQEALTNASKHGHASRAVVEVTEREGELALTVRDNGNGFDPSAKHSGFGLLGMQERVTLLGGEFQIGSSPERGTTIDVHLPVQRRSAAA